MTLAAVSLDDKYAAWSGEVYMTGTQALVRLPMMQQLRDKAAGLDTACMISGYRGSPLGNFDRALWQARPFVEKHGVHFQPGVNEDTAATALWGTQQVGLFPGAKHDGVYAIWYGKGPGVDRTIDVFKHANLAGTSTHGGVLALAGDDHVCASSTTAHQSEFNFVSATMPVINPAGVQEFLDYGLHGWGLSRYAGLWVGFICIAETVDSSAIVSVDPHRVTVVTPDDHGLPAGGLNIRWPDTPLDQEERLLEHKLDAARAYARANGLDRTVIDGPGRRLGIVTTGKSYLDVRQALDDLGIDEDTARRLGLALYKVGMSWPLEPEGIRRFAGGLDEILVVEEKRGFIEDQIKEILYNLPASARPRVIGKCDEEGRPLLRASGELDPGGVAQTMAARLLRLGADEGIEARLARLRARWAESAAGEPAAMERVPYFCSGCPHNSSTKVPEGSRALSGIGCHYMAQWMDRETDTYTHMGGEGANWIGQAPFTETEHIFQNIGDGTYFHSGILAIRAAVAANVNMTYKILYNDAVAMTGGQPMDGPLSVQRVTRQIHAEGVGRIAVVTDQPEKYPFDGQFADGVTIHHRDELDQVQRDLRQWEGVSAIVYDQMCATEKRRRRKRGCWRTRTGGSSSTRTCARAVATAACSRTASRWCRWRPSSGASGRSTNPPATRISPASRASARASCWSRAESGARAHLPASPSGPLLRCPSPPAPRSPSPTASCWRASAAPGSSPSPPCWARRHGWRARGPRCSTRPASPRSTAPSPAISASPSGPRISTLSASPSAARGCCWGSTGWWRRAARR